MNHLLTYLLPVLLAAGIFFSSCGRHPLSGGDPGTDKETAPAGNPYIPDSTALFALLPPEKTHIDFSNILTEGLNTNVLVYEYFYNGGGGGAGGFDGGGGGGIFFFGELTGNKICFRKGAFRFAHSTRPPVRGAVAGPSLKGG